MTQVQKPAAAAFGELFISDGGIETTLIYLEGENLPYFAAFVLLEDAKGWEILRGY